MSAPSFFHSLRASRHVLLTILVALLVAGCAAPGAGHLQRPPDGLPASMAYVTADVLGFTLHDTDPDSKRWAPFTRYAEDEDEQNRALARLHAPLFAGDDVALDEVDPWIGDTAGLALRQLDLDGDTDTSTLYFADVERRADLERFLDAHGWSKQSKRWDLGAGLTLWTNEQDGPVTALGVADDAVIGARTTAALDSLVESADTYAVQDRKTMSEYAVAASTRSPLAVVFRSDLLRTQVRRPFQDDPALLELARWATEANTLVALRDGWIGIQPPIDRSRDAVRLVGTIVWVPELAPDVQLDEPVERAVLDRVASDAAVTGAIAVHAPGAILADAAAMITRNNIQYATAQDVPEGEERIELLPLLERLDGDGAIGWGPGSLHGRFLVEDPDEVAADLRAALELADVPAQVDVSDGGVDVRVETRPEAGADARAQGQDAAQSGYDEAFAAVGVPRREPSVWLWHAPTSCLGPAAGWMTFDGVEELTLSMDVGLRGSGAGAGSADCDPLSVVARASNVLD